MSDEEFYNLTPRQIDALSQRFRQRTEEQEFLFSQLTSYVINFSHPRNRGEDWKPTSTKDFMPSEWRKQPQVKAKRINRKAVADGWRRFLSGK